MQLIDFHTHQIRQEAHIQIRNIFAQDLPFSDDRGLCSVGLHPWHIGLVNEEMCLSSIEQTATDQNILAIGECGLDRSISTDFAIQELYFRKQIEIAEEHSKPLIIHCVRAFNDLIRIKNESRSAVPWIIHGFNGNQQTVDQLRSHNFHFSIGNALLKNHAKKNILTNLPLDSIFFETDNQETSIESVYLIASQQFNIDKEILSEIVSENFKRLFGSRNAVNNNLI